MGKRPRVLILEQQDYMAEIVARIMHQAGAEAVICLSLQAAIEYLERHEQPGLIVMDLGLGGKDSPEMIDAIRCYEREHAIPLIITAAIKEADHPALRKLRAGDRCLPRPYRPVDLKQAARQMLYAHS